VTSSAVWLNDVDIDVRLILVRVWSTPTRGGSAGLFGDDLDAVATRLDEAVTGRDKDYPRTGSSDAQVVDLGRRRSPGR
jgi:hypothetical protein